MRTSEYRAHLELVPQEPEMKVNHKAIKTLARLKAEKRRQRLLATVVWTAALLVVAAVAIILTR